MEPRSLGRFVIPCWRRIPLTASLRSLLCDFGGIEGLSAKKPRSEGRCVILRWRRIPPTASLRLLYCYFGGIEGGIFARGPRSGGLGDALVEGRAASA